MLHPCQTDLNGENGGALKPDFGLIFLGLAAMDIEVPVRPTDFQMS
jgi:hypothetical protein